MTDATEHDARSFAETQYGPNAETFRDGSVCHVGRMRWLPLAEFESMGSGQSWSAAIADAQERAAAHEADLFGAEPLFIATDDTDRALAKPSP